MPMDSGIVQILLHTDNDPDRDSVVLSSSGMAKADPPAHVGWIVDLSCYREERVEETRGEKTSTMERCLCPGNHLSYVAIQALHSRINREVEKLF